MNELFLLPRNEIKFRGDWMKNSEYEPIFTRIRMDYSMYSGKLSPKYQKDSMIKAKYITLKP